MKSRYVSPLNDAVFAHVFGEQRNINNTREFLKALLDEIPEDDYDKLTVKNTVLKPAFRWRKTGIVDILLNTKSGRNIQIEMQVQKTKNLRNRIVFYATRLIEKQLRRGNNYSELHQVISIIICNHILLEEELSYINVYELRNAINNHPFTDLLKIIILELPKVPKKDNQPVWPWLQFFKCQTTEDYEMLLKKHPKLKSAVESTHRATFGERLEATFFLLDKQRRDLRAWKQEVREEAREDAKLEAREEAREEARKSLLQVARKMKARGRPLDEIVEDTGLSKDIIENL